jgi:hypothetical protein
MTVNTLRRDTEPFSRVTRSRPGNADQPTFVLHENVQESLLYCTVLTSKAIATNVLKFGLSLFAQSSSRVQ